MPVASAIVETAVPCARFKASTVAPGSIACCASCTVPSIAPRCSCAVAGCASRSAESRRRGENQAHGLSFVHCHQQTQWRSPLHSPTTRAVAPIG